MSQHIALNVGGRRRATTRRRPGLIALASLTLLAASLLATAPAAGQPPDAQSTGEYGPPQWFPLRWSDDGAQIRVGCTYRSYGGPHFDCNGWHPVWALDLGAAQGTPVYAAGKGFATIHATGSACREDGGTSYGNAIIVDHGEHGKTLYGHLAAIDIPPAGAWVDQETQIGRVGSTGSAPCSFPHLHFERFAGSPWNGAVDPGALNACHGSSLVTYPEAFGRVTWEGIPWGVEHASSDGTACADGQPVDPEPSDAEVVRLAGSDRHATAVAISNASFAGGSAEAVVLARGDVFPDALAGAPLAVTEGGPLLLTPPDRLLDPVAVEIERVLPSDGRVFLLGGEAALSEEIRFAVEDLGYDTVRLAGSDRYATAAAVARHVLEQAHGPVILLATGLDFPDALTAGTAAAAVALGSGGAEAGAAAGPGAVLLTTGTQIPHETQALLAEHPDAVLYAVGGPAAEAAPDATPLAGPDRYATAVEVARAFFDDDAATVGVATGRLFADALGGGPHTAALGGPLLLSRDATVPKATEEELAARAGRLVRVTLYGGEAALSAAVEERIRTLLASA